MMTSTGRSGRAAGLKYAFLGAAWLVLSGCGGGSAPDYGNMYVETYLDAIRVTFQKGNCCGRLVIDDASQAAQDAVVAFARYISGRIPGDGSSPSSDPQLLAFIPVDGEFDSWAEDVAHDGISGPWLITTTAFEWIDGSGVPFDDNNFEGVAGDFYDRAADGWSVTVEVVYMTAVQDAVTAFTATGWDSGTQL